MQNYAVDLLLTLIILLVVIGLAWLMLHGLKKVYTNTHKNTGLHLKLTLPIGNRERIIVVQHNNHEYLLGVTANNISLIDKNPTAPNLKSSSEEDSDDERSISVSILRPDRG